MTASTHPAGPAASAGAAHGAASTALGAERWRRTRLFGVVLLIIAESMLFVPLFAIRFLLAGTGRPEGLGLGHAALLTAVMVASLVAVHVARRAAIRERSRQAAGALWVGATLGLATAVGSGIGWADPALDASSAFGGIFYITTGAHAVHLVAGSAFLGGLAIQARQGRLGGSGRTLLDATYWFWVFLVVVWLAIDVVFYGV